MQPPPDQVIHTVSQDVEHGHVGITVPDIAIQPPTTMTLTQSVNQSSTSRPVHTVPEDRGRMYSASTSTDTDVLDLHQHNAHGMGPLPNPQEGQWGAIYKNDNKNNKMKAEVMFSEEEKDELVLSVENLKHVLDETQQQDGGHDKDSALGGLIGSSFVAGALGPVLAPMVNLPLETLSQEKESPDHSRHPEPPETARWASSGKEIPMTPLTSRDSGKMKVKTSNNTPVERVSVQSFRSIPPIPTTTDGVTSPRNVRSQASLDLESVEEARV